MCSAWFSKRQVKESKMRAVFVIAWTVTALSGAAHAHQAPTVPSQQDYLKRVMMAAPPQVVEQATIIRMDGSTMQTLKKGTNEWTCMEASGVPMYMDPNASGHMLGRPTVQRLIKPVSVTCWP
jgi:hypothetical protein